MPPVGAACPSARGHPFPGACGGGGSGGAAPGARGDVPPVRRGQCLAYTGDTNITGDLPRLAQGADLLLADGLFPKAAWGEQKPHLSAAQCGELARDAGAKTLVVTHLNPEHDPETLLREARECYPGAELARTGLSLEI